jgi:hypothetical protein
MDGRTTSPEGKASTGSREDPETDQPNGNCRPLTLQGLELHRITETLDTLLPGARAGEHRKPILETIRRQAGGWKRKPGETPEQHWLQKIGPHNSDNYKQRGLGDAPLATLISNSSLIRYQDGCELTFQDKVRIRESSMIETAWSWRFNTEEAYAEEENRDFNPNFRVFGKITSSLWRHARTSDWNTSALVFNHIRNFKIESLKDSQITLDWAIGINEKGYCAYNRNTFSDGPLVFLVHVKGQHVMNIGFTVLPKKTIAINQIQMVNAKGNRFLFKFNRVRDITLAFLTCFPGFKILLITGESASNIIQSALEETLQGKEEALQRADSKKETQRILTRFKPLEEKAKKFEPEIKPRLLALYPDSTGDLLEYNNILFRRMRKKETLRWKKSA